VGAGKPCEFAEFVREWGRSVVGHSGNPPSRGAQGKVALHQRIRALGRDSAASRPNSSFARTVPTEIPQTFVCSLPVRSLTGPVSTVGQYGERANGHFGSHPSPPAEGQFLVAMECIRQGDSRSTEEQIEGAVHPKAESRRSNRQVRAPRSLLQFTTC